jgi:hypothetical protein
MDCVLITPDAHIPKKELYTHYCEYCRRQKYPVAAENQFHKGLQASIRVADYRPREDGVRVQCWKGISVKDRLKINEDLDNPDIPDTVNPVNDVKGFFSLGDPKGGP